MSSRLDDRIEGCLYGAVLGTELGIQRLALGGPTFDMSNAREALEVELDWRDLPPRPTGPAGFTSLTPLLHSVGRAYLTKGGRITPEDWAEELKEDPEVGEDKAFWLIDVHSTMEVLREGMNPRLSGLGAVPTGNIAAAIAPVGIYHAGDPESAYLDAVEIASVTQRSPAVEWAALTAAAIAEALKPGATAGSVIDTVLRTAQSHSKDLFYRLNHMVRQAHDRDQYLPIFAYSNRSEMHQWVGDDPVGWALSLLSVLGDDPRRLLTVSVLLDAYPSIRPSVAGAIAGALNGAGALPETWVDGASEYVAPLLGLTTLTRRKLERERVVTFEIEKLTRADEDEASLLFDKVYGCILAGAIGNAMGSVVEGQSYEQIDARYPDGITTVLDPSRLEGEDDNQMAMLLTETYIERDGLPVSARHFGDKWKRRLNRDHFFYCMKSSYDLIRAGMDPRITGHWSLVTGSTVMCMEPVGTYHLCEPENAFIDATSISYMYQRGLDVTAASILAASVAEAFRPDATVDSVLAAALDAAPRERMITFDRRDVDTPYDFISLCLDVAAKYTDVLAARRELYEKCLYYHMIDPLELLGLSYAMLKIADGDVRLAAIGGTNIGRDSDTISGRAAMLAGTLNGGSSVPVEWVDLFRPESLERIRTNAARIAHLLMDRKLPYLRARQELLR